VGLADLEDWAKHMPISHHRNGLRQAVHSVAGGLRSQVKIAQHAVPSFLLDV